MEPTGNIIKGWAENSDMIHLDDGSVWVPMTTAPYKPWWKRILKRKIK